jgi:CBS domain-containing protein
MPNAFDAANAPFDRLTSQEVETLRAALDIAYFRPGETIIAQNAPASALFVVIKGTVEERDGGDLLALLGPKDSFDSRALVHGKSGHAFVAREETLCYTCPKGVTISLIQSNPRFASFFYREISHKLDELARDEEERRYGSLMRARVSELFLHPPAFIDASDTIEAAGHLMREIDSNALFVRDGERIGIITGMNLSKAVVLRRQPIETPVREFAHFDVVTLRPDDFVSAALVLMTKRTKRRVAVHDGERYIGILEDIDLLGFLAGSAQVVAGRIDRASSRDDLAVAARETVAQVRTLRRQGVKVEVIGEVVSDLNGRLFSRLFEMVANPCRRLSRRHGQRRSRRADRTHRSGQRVDPGRPRRQGRAGSISDRFFRCVGRLRLSALSRQCDGTQPGLVKAALRISCGFPALGGVARRSRSHERGNLLRCACRCRRRAAAGRGQGGVD